MAGLFFGGLVAADSSIQEGLQQLNAAERVDERVGILQRLKVRADSSRLALGSRAAAAIAFAVRGPHHHARRR